MDLTTYVSSLREDLTTTASAGDEQTRKAAAMLSAALEPAARLAIMNALSDLAAEVTASLEDHVVDIRLDGREVRVAVTRTGASEAPDDAEAAEHDQQQQPPHGDPADTGDISRMTLRLFEEMKGQAEQAAAQQGVSLNTFVTRAVQNALQGGRRGPHGRRRGPAGPWQPGAWPWDGTQPGRGERGSGPGFRGGHPGRGGTHLRGWVQG